MSTAGDQDPAENPATGPAPDPVADPAADPEEDSFRLSRKGGDRGPSLSERISERLHRLAFSSPVHRMHLRGRFPLKLLAVPADPLPGNAERGQRLRAGRLFRDGYGQGMASVRFDASEAPESWRRWVNSWGWLRDLAQAPQGGPQGTPLSATDAARAEALARRWLERYHNYDAEAWEPATTGRRLLMAMMHAPAILSGHDHIHRSALLNGLARWGRHLERATPGVRPGMARIEAAAGLIGCGLMLPGGDERQRQGEALLTESLNGFLPGDVARLASRSPLDLARLGDLMLVLAAFHHARGQKPSLLIEQTLATVRASLAALAMPDGLPAPWHGGQPSPAQMARLAVPAEGRPPAHSSGWTRLDAGTTRILIDSGPPPPARQSDCGHASTLAFVLGDGPRAIIVSCGAEAGDDGRHPLPPELVAGLRSTAGHSALVLADTSSSRLHDGGPRQLGGVQEVDVDTRSNARGHWFEGRHDGWRRTFGYDCLRRLWLSPDGLDLRGEDRLEPVRRANLLHRHHSPTPFAIRFHLGLNAEATLTEDGQGALIQPGGERGGKASTAIAWAFRASFHQQPGRLAIEPSILVDCTGGERPIQQLVLSGLAKPGAATSVSWSLKRQGGRP